MTKPGHRTRGSRRVPVRLPSGKRTIHFMPRAHGPPTCAKCGGELHGATSSRKPLAGSLRVPTRPYAGVLCHNCLATEIRQLAHATGPEK